MIFYRDLYYRISNYIFHIHIPALKEKSALQNFSAIFMTVLCNLLNIFRQSIKQDCNIIYQIVVPDFQFLIQATIGSIKGIKIVFCDQFEANKTACVNVGRLL